LLLARTSLSKIKNKRHPSPVTTPRQKQLQSLLLPKQSKQSSVTPCQRDLHLFKGKKVAGFDSTAGIRMKGTIYLWVLAAVWLEHLSDCLGS
jgi:hypothetical protein